MVNTFPGILSLDNTSVSSDNFIPNSKATYFFRFNPINYLQNMHIKITASPEVIFSSSYPTCTGIFGIDTPLLSCTLDITDKSITITNAFKLQPTPPWNVVFSISPFMNPNNSN